MCRIRIVVSTPRCGRGNLSSNLRCDIFVKIFGTPKVLFFFEKIEYLRWQSLNRSQAMLLDFEASVFVRDLLLHQEMQLLHSTGMKEGIEPLFMLQLRRWISQTRGSAEWVSQMGQPDASWRG